MKNKLHRIMPRAALVFCMICALACFSLKNNDVAKAKASATPAASPNIVQEAWERGYESGTKAAKEEVAKCLVPGDHGTTFGGNPLACAAVAKTLEIFVKREIPNHVEEVGEYLNECLQKLVEKKEIAVETRGMGLMRGLELSVPAGPYITKALEKGVIFMSAGANVIRFIPPLIIEKSDVDKMIAILDSVLDD